MLVISLVLEICIQVLSLSHFASLLHIIVLILTFPSSMIGADQIIHNVCNFVAISKAVQIKTTLKIMPINLERKNELLVFITFQNSTPRPA